MSILNKVLLDVLISAYNKPRLKTINTIVHILTEILTIFNNVTTFLTRVRQGGGTTWCTRDGKAVYIIENGKVMFIARKTHANGVNYIRMVVSTKGFDIIYVKGSNFIRICMDGNYAMLIAKSTKSFNIPDVMEIIEFLFSFIESLLLLPRVV